MEFMSHHQIWQTGLYYGDIDDYLNYATNLIDKWLEKKYEFGVTYFDDKYEIQVATLLLFDSLLPIEARKAFAMVMLAGMHEISETKGTSKSFHIKPPPRGRKKNEFLEHQLLFGAAHLIKAGTLKTEAYSIVAQEHNKSPDTVRRIYERHMKERKLRWGK